MYIGYCDREGRTLVRYRPDRKKYAYLLIILVLAAATAAVIFLFFGGGGADADALSGSVTEDSRTEQTDAEITTAEETQPAEPVETAAFDIYAVRAEVEEIDISCDIDVIESGDPLVLIIHTHSGEGYSDSEDGRSDDPSQNVMSVGTEFAKVLADEGICAIHCSVRPDDQMLFGSYSRAAELISRYKAEYPTLLYVVDIHRVSGESVSGDDKSAYIRMLASLSDECPDSIPVAMSFTKRAGGIRPDLCLPVNASDSTFNHDLCFELGMYPLTLEIGTENCSVSDAKASADVTARVFAEMIKGTD